MHIGIDATALPERLFGAGNYIVNLIAALSRLDTPNEYVVFVKPFHASLFKTLQRARTIQVALPMRTLRIAWEQTALPILARQYKLDVLHSPHYSLPLAAPCATVVTFHDMTFFLYPQAHLLYKRIFFRTMIPLAARRATSIIAISESTRQDILRLLKTPSEKVNQVSYGISSQFHLTENCNRLDEARHKYNLPAEFALYVGNLEPRKNLPILLQAFARLVHQGLPHSLVLVGSRGWKDDAVFTTLSELGISDRVHFLGYVTQDELPLIYQASRVFVYPSLYEGFGLPVLEAMACGTPVITSNVSSMPEVAGDAGLLINPNSIDELTVALQRALTDSELRVTLAQKGLKRAQSFSWERTARETLAVYEQSFRNR
ncbi:MAG: glycosyltransferase family 4 protein [Chloroflexi bacterium]|nr:glycosyltransferase family 4 protein [Chloroflexota bacterium]